MVHSSCQRGEDEWGHGPVAQWTEHRSSEPGVAGSSPAGPTNASIVTCGWGLPLIERPPPLRCGRILSHNIVFPQPAKLIQSHNSSSVMRGLKRILRTLCRYDVTVPVGPVSLSPALSGMAGEEQASASNDGEREQRGRW